MFIQLTTILCAVQMLAEECKCVKLFDHHTDSEEPNSIIGKELSHNILMQYAPVNLPIMGERRPTPNSMRRHKTGRILRRQFKNFPDRTEQIKLKIATLAEQAILDTNRTIISIRSFKNQVSSMAEYKIGYILSYIKKERKILNDFFDLAVAYRDHSVVLQQMKVFEYIMQSSRNITSLVRQAIQIHIQNRDSIPTLPTTTPEPTTGIPDESYTAGVIEFVTTAIFERASAVTDDTTTAASDLKVPERSGIPSHFYKHIG